ncbi:MAG: histidine kinase [Gammaproteobacteria bacterium]|nr:histidine kinase [Gammaproteobacteria bacterium]
MNVQTDRLHLQPTSSRLFWVLHIGGWLAYFLHGYLAGLAHGKHAGYWKLQLATAMTGFLVTLGLRWLLRALWQLPPQKLIAAMIAPVLVASALMGACFLFALIDWCGEECRPANTLGYVAYATGYVYVIMAWVGLYVGIKYYRQLQQQTSYALAATATAHQAQLKMLRYQLNPHFLFNTLNAISTLILDRANATANRMVQGLSAFLRHSLDADPMQRVTLKQEMDAIDLYLNIERLRFPERLRINIGIAPECWSALVPSLLLQPLIENAIKHAVAKRVAGGTVWLRAGSEDGKLVLSVLDDGPGCPALENGELPPGSGVGLANTRQRLRVLYGSLQSFEIRNRPEGGLAVTIILPFETGAADIESLAE